MGHLEGELQQLQTTLGTYVGRMSEAGRGFLVLSDPVVVTRQNGGDGQADEFFATPLTADPYGIDGPIVISEMQIIHAADVALDSSLADAYQAAMTEPSGPDESP